MADNASTAPPAPKGRTAALTVAALGVVYGDIGTSPLYTIKECFGEFIGLKPTPENVLGILSLITWALIIVPTVKYVVFLMRADNRGEGGVLALAALISGRGRLSDSWRRTCLMLGVLGAALFFGDCLLTPAISVLSAVEGLNVATPAFAPMVLPIALGVIIALFAAQRFGTGAVGRWFGPITAIWFAALMVLGAVEIAQHPAILLALDPSYAVGFAIRHQWIAFVALGAVTLAVTGAEALYADMGHFGRRPIRIAWLVLVLPSLIVNYFGQGALIIRDPAALENPFFRLAPDWALYPMVALATIATVIASQATISGAFSMARQASLLGLLPRLGILHTSATESGQIYVPAVNWLQLAGVVVLVIEFKTSSNLAAAYGVAVTGTMLVTTVLALVLAVRVWNWGWLASLAATGLFLVVDSALLSSNMLKVAHGGWVPLALGACIFVIMWTWLRGRTLVAEIERDSALPVALFIERIEPGRQHRPQGTAVYLTALADGVPNSLLHNLKHNESLHEHVVLLTIEVPDIPYVAASERTEVTHLGKGLHRIVLRYGFMESPDVPRDLAPLASRGVPLEEMRTSYFVGRNSLVAATKSPMPRWQEKLFLGLSRIASSAGDFFRLPPNRVVELGSRIEV